MSYTVSGPLCELKIPFDESREGQHHKRLHDEIFRLDAIHRKLQAEIEELKKKLGERSDE
jgi:hypothetical protein